MAITGKSGKHLSLSEAIIEILTDKAGVVADRSEVATLCAVNKNVARDALNSLVEDGQIKTRLVGKCKGYYIESDKAQQVPATGHQPRVFRQYVMPPEMALQMARCKADRSAVNSFFGEGA